MASALEAGYDLSALAGCFLLIGLLSVIAFTFAKLATVLDVGIGPYHPFRGVSHAISNTIVDGCNSGIRSLERIAASFESGLIDSFGLLIAIPALLFVGVRALTEYLWHTAIPSFVHSITNPIVRDVAAVRSSVAALTTEVQGVYNRAVSYTNAAEAKTLGQAEAYVNTQLSGVLHTAEAYADRAVGQLAASESGAINNAISIAHSALAAANAAEAAAVGEAERFTTAAVAASEAAGARALTAVRSIAITAEQDLGQIEGNLGALGVAGLIASIPALATIVNAIATEAGLENSDCRSKVKGICGTNTGAWTNLIAGLAVVGAGFDLASLAGAANMLVTDLGGVVADLA
jgi:hypothetical protein